MMDNERRADLGFDAVYAAAAQTNVHTQEDAYTALTDVLSYICHYCDRLGLNAAAVLDDAHLSYEGDFEDGPRAERTLDPNHPMVVLYPPVSPARNERRS